jgi:hypothetical protein
VLWIRKEPDRFGGAGIVTRCGSGYDGSGSEQQEQIFKNVDTLSQFLTVSFFRFTLSITKYQKITPTHVFSRICF